MRVIFICTGNTCRSAMAEHLFRKYLSDHGRSDVSVASAGTSAQDGMPSPREVMAVFARHDVDANPRSTAMNAEIIRSADLILTMTASHRDQVLSHYPEAKDKTFRLKDFTGKGGDIPDPIFSPQSVYDTCADEIQETFPNLLKKI